MGLWTRHPEGHDTSALVHHSDSGPKTSLSATPSDSAGAGPVASIGSTGDNHDNAMAEAFNRLFKAGLVRSLGPWKNVDDLAIAVAEYIDWFNHRRLHGEIGLIPPVEYETQHPQAPLTEATRST